MMLGGAGVRVLLAAAVVGGFILGERSEPHGGRNAENASAVPGEEDGRGGEPAAELEAEDEERVERHGVARRTGPIVRRRTIGWAGERLFGRGNDWEPAAAADPSAPYVYVLTTRYSGRGPLPCPSCDIPAIALEVSSDGGRSFGPTSFLPVDVRGGQYDPVIETDGAGVVYAAWLNGGFRVVFSRSSDNGVTWSDPVVISRGAGWGDHPWLAVGQTGADVYVAFNHSDSYIAQSHDGGATWEAPIKTNGQDRFHYAGGGYVGADGTVTFSQSNYPHFDSPPPRIRVVVTRSTDGGTTWQTEVVDEVELQPPCLNPECPNNHYGGHASLGGDADGDLVLAYDGAVVRRGPQFIYVRRSIDGGVTWSARKRVSPGGEIVATTPQVVGTGDDDFRLWYMDERRGSKRWNTWYVASTDGGLTWSDEVRISDARSGTGYKHPQGFDADYGDYGDIVVTSSGATLAVWGEGFGYSGPGGTWYNRAL